jgi:hypothetical protein|tara:strand:+ start:43 stop:414 length:372 start_codon:yes stop_codon:yes gene_type:complete
MSTIINGKAQNEITDLATLSRNLYENIFNVNLIEDNNVYFYNLLNKVIFPDDISDEFTDEITLMSDKPWTMLSFQLYGTINLWWTVYLLNKPDYIFKAQANNTYKFIKSKYITSVLNRITIKD